MSQAHTGIASPFAKTPGEWVPGLANTDPEFFRELLGGFSTCVGLYEKTAADSLQSSPEERYAGVFVLPAAPPLMGIEGVRQSRPAASGNSVLVCYDLQGTVPAQCMGSPRIVQIVAPASTVQQFRPEQWFGLFAAPAETTAPSVSVGGAASQVVHAPSATVPARDRDAENRFEAAFRRGVEERFEDGMESGFSKELESLVRRYGSVSRDVLSRLLQGGNLSASVWAEALRCLGRIDDPNSREARLWVLEKGLTSRSPLVRDGAALGIASMDDPSAIPYLQRAIEAETVRELRADMLEVLAQLTSQR